MHPWFINQFAIPVLHLGNAGLQVPLFWQKLEG